MAVPLPALCRQVARASHRTQWLKYRRQGCPSQAQRREVRPFSSTRMRLEDDRSPTEPTDQVTTAEASSEAEDPYFNKSFYDSLYSDEADHYLRSSPSARREQESMRASFYEQLGPRSRNARDMEAFVEQETYATREELGPDYSEKSRPPKLPDDFSTMGETDPEIAPNEEWKDDDISSTAHGELDQHREMREYARLAAWEMPLLANLAVPFQAPSASQPLRWRYTTYLGTPHPAAHKVVLTFSPTSLNLKPTQVTKLIKLAGPRYDPHTNTIKMSSESFPSQAQNKRYLGDTFRTLLAEAKNEKDKMEDIPLDFRHAKHKKEKLAFPTEWLLTAQRKTQLEERRQALQGEEARRLQEVQGGEMLDGIRVIEGSRFEETQRVAATVASGDVGRAAAGQALRGARR